MWRWTSAGLMVHSWDVAGNSPRCLNVLHDALSKAVGARTFLTHVDIRQFSTSDYCGLCTVRWIDHKLRGRMLPTTTDEVHYLHGVARHQYAEFLKTQVVVPGLGFGRRDLTVRHMVVCVIPCCSMVWALLRLNPVCSWCVGHLELLKFKMPWPVAILGDLSRPLPTITNHRWR